MGLRLTSSKPSRKKQYWTKINYIYLYMYVIIHWTTQNHPSTISFKKRPTLLISSTPRNEIWDAIKGLKIITTPGGW